MTRRRFVAVAILVGAPLFYWHFRSTVRDSEWRSVTYDEPLHLVGGWSYWKLHDYRLHPTNGPLMQRWLTLPYFFLFLSVPSHDGGGHQPILPPTDGPDFRKATKLGEDYGRRFLFEAPTPNLIDDMVRCSRGMNALLAICLAIIALAACNWVYPGSTCLLTASALLLCPNIVAHAGLATSDVGAAFGFLLAISCWARLLELASLGRLFWSILAWGILAGIKMSAALILPIAVVAALPTVLGRRPWRFRIGDGAGWARRPSNKAIMLLIVLGLHVAVAAAMVWSYYGFRYSAFATYEPELDDFTTPWEKVLDREAGVKGKLIRAARDHQLMPEAYLYGLAHTLRFQERATFLNGRYSTTGWWYYFPAVFLMKTPLPTLSLFLLAAWQGARVLRPTTLRAAAKRERRLRRAWPFLALVMVYSLAACASSLNIGYRHLLPILPPLFVLAGALELARPAVRIAACLLVAWLAVENVMTRPYYLSYFNELAGGRDRGYLHLSDSNIDWGQDLPSFAAWIKRLRGGGDRAPIQFSYFGGGDPLRYFEIHDAVKYPKKADYGWYCYSATELTGAALGPPRWSDHVESQTREAGGVPSDETRRALDAERRHRVRAWLLQRTPDVVVGGSILIFRVSNDDALRMLTTPPPQRRADG